MELQLAQELPPPPEGMWLSMLRSDFERDTKRDIALLEGLLHLGQSAGSSHFDRGRINSNLQSHLGHLYS